LKLIVAGLLAVASLYSADNPIIEPSQRTDATFRLFRTQNIFNFLELDTRNGRVWQVQWSLEEKERIIWPINTARLGPDPANTKPGKYTLYPTSNIFTFMLLDQEDGFTWQIQWSTKLGEQLITPILAWGDIAMQNFDLAAQDAKQKQAEQPLKTVPPPSSTKPKVVVKPPVPPK
jgi:hypothetical protein